MRMIREILRLHYTCGFGKKKISRSLGCSRQSASNYINRARAAGLTWPLPAELDDEDCLEKFLYPKGAEITGVGRPVSSKPQPDCNYIHQELKKKGVTLNLLWEEYKSDHPDGYQLSHFRGIYRQWRKTVNLSMRQNHKGGEKAFSDFAGGTLNITNEMTGESDASTYVCLRSGRKQLYICQIVLV